MDERRPHAPGGAVPPGTCRYCEQPTGSRARAHEDCRKTWRASNVPADIRAAVFERDNWTCIDCRTRYPESMLEADHDNELADGGQNDPGNFVTRCLTDHDAKTQERRMARTATPAKKPSTRNARATAQLPEKPDARATARKVGGVALLNIGLAGCAHVLGMDGFALASTGVVAALVVIALVSYSARLVHWKRLCESQRVYERLAKVAGVPYAARTHRFKVNTWAGTEARSVTITYGTDFDPQDPRQAGSLADAFARAIGVPAARIRFEPRRAGRVRITVMDDAEAGYNARAPHTDADAHARPELARDPAQADAVSARIQDALNAVIDTDAGHVRVTDWHPNGTPAALVFTYPSRATSRIGENLARVRDTLGRLHPAVKGEWYLVWESHADRLLLSDRPDPLAPVVPSQPVEADPDLYAGVPIGVTEDGEPWRLPLMGGAHWLVAGASGAGKGSVLWGIVRALAPLIKDGRARLWIVDPKGGMEFEAARAFAHRFAVSPTGCAELLEEAKDAMQAKAAAQAKSGRKVGQPTRERPLDVLIVDEIANVTAYVDSKMGKANADAIAALCSMGRAAAFTVVAAVQDPRKEVVRNRGLFTAAVALRLSEPGEVNLVLGSGVRAQGATADLIPKAHPGIAYMIRDGQAGHVRARAAFITDDEIARIAEDLAPAQAPAHSARALGEQLAFDARATREPVAVGEVLATANIPARVRMSALTDGARVLLPNDPDPVTITSVEPDPDEPDDRVEVTYVYDGETGERVCSFDRSEEATTL